MQKGETRMVRNISSTKPIHKLMIVGSITTPPTRKRQKKSDSRVTELEKKIDALTSMLHNRDQLQGQLGNSGQPGPGYQPTGFQNEQGTWRPGGVNHEWSSSPLVRAPEPARAYTAPQHSNDYNGMSTKRRRMDDSAHPSVSQLLPAC